MAVSYKTSLTKRSGIASSGGFLFWKWIEVGSKFHELSEPIKEAILSHEMGHIKEFHQEQRLLCFLLYFPALFRLCRWQELRADTYAAKRGHAKSLLELFKGDSKESLSHPSNAVRRKNLEKYV